MNVELLGSRQVVSSVDIHRIGLIAAEAHRLGLGVAHVQATPAAGDMPGGVRVVVHLVPIPRRVTDPVTARELGDLLRGLGADWRHLTEQSCVWEGRDHTAMVAAVQDLRAVITAIGSPRPRHTTRSTGRPTATRAMTRPLPSS